MAATARAAEEPPAVTEPPAQKDVAGTPITPLKISGERMAKVTAEGLPAGLTLNEVSETEAQITGTPKKAESVVVTLKATNKENVETSKTFSWTIEAEQAATIEKPPDQTSKVGKTITPVSVKGTHLAAVTAKELPEGLALTKVSETEWRITGKPTTAKPATKVTLEAFNKEGAGPVTTTLEWTVEEVEAAPTIEKPANQTSTAGTAITPVSVKGAHLATVTAKELPEGLTLTKVSETEWTITGTPTTVRAASTVTLDAFNEEGTGPVNTSFEWTVEKAVVPPPPPPPAAKGPTSSGALAVSPGVVFSAARASCGGLSWSTSAVVTQWLLDGAPIAGATAATYTPPRAYDGRRLSCRQTATGGGGSSSASSPGRVVHEQPAQPSWPIGPASTHCSAPVCMQEGARPGGTGQAYPQGGSWWGSQQVRCVSAPWTSAVGDSAQPAVKAFAQASTVRLTLQRITSAGPVTVASQELGNLGVARDLLDGASGSPFGGTIVSPFGGQPFQGNELWSTRFPGAAGKPNWFAPGAGLLAYGTSSPAGLARSFQLTYTLTSADLGARLRCLAGAEDGAPGAATVASFASPEYAVAPSGRCGPRRLAGVSGPQPAIVAAGDPRCLGAPSSMAAIGGGFQGVAVKNGEAAVSLVCGLSGGCRGTVSLLAARAHGAPVSIGGASVRVGRGGVRLLHLTLNRKGRQLLRGAGGAGLPASLRLSTRGQLRGLAAFTLLSAG